MGQVSQKHILIIEDEPTLLRLLEKKIQDAGYRVSVAKDGKEGLERIAADRPDLILLDIMMPTLDGFGVLEDLSARGMMSAIPVIIISNSGQPVEIERAKKLGVKDFLVKANFTPQEVLDKVIGQIGAGTVDAPQQEAGDGAGEAVSAAEGSGGEAGAFTHRILLVEDDKFLRNLLMRKLNIEGFQNVETAETGSEALTKIKELLPELVLLDLILPDISGYEILEVVKKDEATKNVPIIVLSNLGQKDELDKCRALGAEECLVKANFSTKDITQKIRNFFVK